MTLKDFKERHQIGALGNTFIKTPHLDKLASESAVFQHAYTSGKIRMETTIMKENIVCSVIMGLGRFVLMVFLEQI